ncbi:MAG: Hsp20/alpha crystallin family protein [Bdellovibrionales bacterium]
MKTLVPFWVPSFSSDLWRDVDRLFDGFATPSLADYPRAFTPATEVEDNDNHFMVSLDLPGMKKEDIKIDVENNTLIVSGERKREEKTDTKRYHRIERSFGSFKRSFTLADNIDVEKIAAHHEDGVLRVYIPKAAASQARKVEIQSGKDGFFDRLLGSKKSTDLKDVNEKVS